jgi:dihydrofolate reductase
LSVVADSIDQVTTTYLVASSLDGFIADEHDRLDWLTSLPGGFDEASPYHAFIKDIGAIAMGATTYEWILAHDSGPWPYEQPSWVFTHRDLPVRPGGGELRFTQSDVETVHKEMSDAAGDQGIWLVGGGDLVGQFLDADLLDELIVSITPVTLGRGAPLLPRRHTRPFRLVSATPSPAGTFVHLRYVVRDGD